MIFLFCFLLFRRWPGSSLSGTKVPRDQGTGKARSTTATAFYPLLPVSCSLRLMRLPGRFPPGPQRQFILDNKQELQLKIFGYL